MLDILNSTRPTSAGSTNMANFLERTWAWLSVNSWEIIAALLIGFGIYLILAALKGRAASYTRNQVDRLSLSAIIGRTLSKTGHFFMLMVSIRLVTGLAGTPSGPEKVIAFLFTIAVVFQVAVWVREVAIGLIERRATGAEEAGSETLANAMTLIRIIITVVVFAIALIMVLDNIGVDVTGLVAGLGVGGIAIGLAAQGIFSDLFAALSIIFDKPFKKGDTVDYGGGSGAVEKIGLKSTRLRAFTGEQIIISNTNLLDKDLQNVSERPHRRVKFAVGVIYQTPADVAASLPDLFQQIVEAQDDLKFVRSGFVGFGASSLDYELEFDASADFAIMYKARHDVGMAILKTFADKSIEIAYPTQTTFTAAPDGSAILPYPEKGFPVQVEN